MTKKLFVVEIATEYDCQSCGACCQIRHRKFGEYLVGLTAKDEDRLTASQAMRFVGDDPHGPVMKIRRNGNCVALQGTVGEKVSCEIYGKRPETCSDFNPGNDRCKKWRKEIGL